MKHAKARAGKTQAPNNKCTHTRTHSLHITPPDAILNIGLQSAVGKIYLDGGHIHIHKNTYTLMCTCKKQVHRGVRARRKEDLSTHDTILANKHTINVPLTVPPLSWDLDMKTFTKTQENGATCSHLVTISSTGSQQWGRSSSPSWRSWGRRSRAPTSSSPPSALSWDSSSSASKCTRWKTLKPPSSSCR